MRKRIVDIGDVDALGCPENAFGDVELDAVSDADVDITAQDEHLYMTRADCARVMMSAAEGSFLAGSFLGGFLGIGVGAIGAALLVSHHYKSEKR